MQYRLTQAEPRFFMEIDVRDLIIADDGSFEAFMDSLERRMDHEIALGDWWEIQQKSDGFLRIDFPMTQQQINSLYAAIETTLLPLALLKAEEKFENYLEKFLTGEVD